MELIELIDSSLFTRFINDKEVVYRKLNSVNLVKYNLITKERIFFKPEGSVQDIATSPDGRFIAYSTLYKDGLNNWSRLYLLDAKTMTQIALLEDVKTDVHYFERMSFSEDGKYLATNASTYSSGFQRNIYSTETLKSVKNYNTENFKTQNLNINFLNDNLYCTKTRNIINSKDYYSTQIYDLKSDKLLLTLNNVYGAIFYSDLNYLYYYDDEKKKIFVLISQIS
jgi:dipeptidyl aminopeptidase/acylaminoacyl peptidase